MDGPAMESRPGSGRRGDALRDVTHVFLDVGGTLLYSNPSATDIFHRVLATRGHHLDRERIARLLRTPETIVTLIRPFPSGKEGTFFREVNARVIEHLGLDSDDAMLDDIHAEYEKGVAWRPYPESLTILRTLRDAGYRLGVISNASHSLPGILKERGLAEYFDTITYSFDVGAEKPDVRIFRRAVAQANATEERSVHVGDCGKGLRRARASRGIPPCHENRSSESSAVAAPPPRRESRSRKRSDSSSHVPTRS